MEAQTIGKIADRNIVNERRHALLADKSPNQQHLIKMHYQQVESADAVLVVKSN